MEISLKTPNENVNVSAEQSVRSLVDGLKIYPPGKLLYTEPLYACLRYHGLERGDKVCQPVSLYAVKCTRSAVESQPCQFQSIGSMSSGLFARALPMGPGLRENISPQRQAAGPAPGMPNRPRAVSTAERLTSSSRAI